MLHETKACNDQVRSNCAIIDHPNFNKDNPSVIFLQFDHLDLEGSICYSLIKMDHFFLSKNVAIPLVNG